MALASTQCLIRGGWKVKVDKKRGGGRLLLFLVRSKLLKREKKNSAFKFKPSFVFTKSKTLALNYKLVKKGHLVGMLSVESTVFRACSTGKEEDRLKRRDSPSCNGLLLK